MKNKLVIIGAGGFGREASLLVEEINAQKQSEGLSLKGFIDEDVSLKGKMMRDYTVLGSWAEFAPLASECQAICVVGDAKAKKALVDTAKDFKARFLNLVHPQVILSRDVFLGSGVLINKGSLLTVNITIGDHVSINPGCGIGHDSVIGSFSTLMWGVNIAGEVKIGQGCLIGSGATVLQGLKVGDGVTIGAGAVVTKNLPAGCTAVGVPARIIG